jgi:hypothetical protein
MVADKRHDLSPDPDRRPADQLPGAGHPDEEADRHDDRDRLHRTGIARVPDHLHSREQLEHEGDYEQDQEHAVAYRGPPDLAHADQRQQGREHEQQPEGRYDRRCIADFLPGYQREQRHRQRVGERRERPRSPDALQLHARLLAGEPLRRHRDGDEQQPDQRAGHSSRREEEVMNVLRYHPTIFPAAVSRCRGAW